MAIINHGFKLLTQLLNFWGYGILVVYITMVGDFFIKK